MLFFCKRAKTATQETVATTAVVIKLGIFNKLIRSKFVKHGSVTKQIDNDAFPIQNSTSVLLYTET